MSALTRDRFLKELRQGKTQVSVLRQFGERPSTIVRWKRESKSFEKELDEALAHRARYAAVTLESRHPTWQDEFIEVYQELGAAYRADPDEVPPPSVSRAVRALAEDRDIEISLGAVMARLSEGNPQYDRIFCERHTAAEADIMGPVEQRYHEDLLSSHDPRLRREALERHPLTRARHRKPADRVEVNKTETRKLIEEHRETYRIEFEAKAIQMFGGGAYEPEEEVTEVIDVVATERPEPGVPGGAGGEEEEAGGGEEEVAATG